MRNCLNIGNHILVTDEFLSYKYFNLLIISVAMIEKILDKMCDDSSQNFVNSNDAHKIHAIEASRLHSFILL